MAFFSRFPDFLIWFRKWIRGDILSALKTRDNGTKPISHGVWNQLLKKHVHNGKVDYKGFLGDKTLLKSYLTLLSENPPNRRHWNQPQQLSYWLNAYNAFTIDLVVQHYPISSIKNLGNKIQMPMINSVWDYDFFRIGGIRMNLNLIEHEILRKHFKDPRIHFAINCASISCPNLMPEAFVAEKLEEQLEAQASSFINDPTKNQISPRVAALSQIFEWFQGDFTRNSALQDFINKYSKEQMHLGTRIRYLPYDWSLNE